MSEVPSSPPAESNELVEAVRNGQRYVIVPYVVSVILWSFRPSIGGVHVVKTGQWPMRQLFLATCVTSLFGWCGIPRGIPWTIATLIDLWRGGRDVTLLLLVAVVGAEEAEKILAASPKPKRPAAMRWLRLLIFIPLFILSALLLCIFIPPPWL